MSNIEYNLMPQGQVLQDFADCRARNSFIMGPLGSGKTVQCILKLFDLMCEQEPVKDPNHKHYGVRLSRVIAARNTYSELFSTTIKDWLEIHGELGDFKLPSLCTKGTYYFKLIVSYRVTGRVKLHVPPGYLLDNRL